MLNRDETGTFRGRSVGVVGGGDTDERDVSVRTGRALTEALRSLGYDVTVYDVPSDVDRLVADRASAVPELPASGRDRRMISPVKKTNPSSNISHPLGNSRAKFAWRNLDVATLDITQ